MPFDTIRCQLMSFDVIGVSVVLCQGADFAVLETRVWDGLANVCLVLTTHMILAPSSADLQRTISSGAVRHWSAASAVVCPLPRFLVVNFMCARTRWNAGSSATKGKIWRPVYGRSNFKRQGVGRG